ncbi:MAG: hypothetical protein DRI57_08420 [Deltaproteobacteria bacterium]|nr:MAG: hypothetical protein DRI57_08420 [Deltaproteobacteria bacterium]
METVFQRQKTPACTVGISWADENVTNRVANCDPVFVPPIFFNLKISRLQNDRNKNGISFLGASTTDSSPQGYPTPLFIFHL